MIAQTNLSTAAAGALSDVHAQAQAQAARMFGAGPVQAWQPQRRSGLAGVRPVVVAGALVTCALVSGMVLGAWRVAPTADSALPPPAVPAPPARADLGRQDARPRPPSTQQHGVTAEAPEPGSLSVSRRGSRLRIEARGASRLDTARRLAAATASSLQGDPGVLGSAPALTLRWQGSDVEQAWRAVLGPSTNYALQCRRQRCSAWILDGDMAAASVPGPMPTLAASPSVVGTLPPLAEVAPALAFVATGGPGGQRRPDPRVAARHD